jgi:PAS domain S-box-containing protein
MPDKRSPILQERIKELPQVGKRTPRGPAFALIALLALAMAIVGALTFQGFDRTARALGEIEHRQATRTQVETVFNLLQDAESSQRGYLLTNDQSFLAPYRSAERRVTEEVAHLQDLMRRDAAQAARVEALRGHVGKRLDEMALVILKRDNEGAQAAASRISEGHGTASMDSIRAIVAELRSTEAAAAEAASARHHAATTAGRRVAVGVLAALVVVLLLAAVAAELLMRLKDRLVTNYVDLAIRRVAEFEEASDGILVLNPDGQVEAINGAAERMFGRPRESIAGTHVQDIMPLVEEGEVPFLTRLETSHGVLGSAEVREIVARHTDGSDAPADVTVRPMHMADGLYIGVYARDISDRKRVEQLKDEFVSTVSHELRTPLTSIAGSLGLLVGGMGAALPEGPARLIAIAHSNCQRLIRLINDMLDVEKIESGKMKFEMAPITVSEAAARSIDAVRGYAEQLGVELRLNVEDEDLVVRGDLDRLVQVGANLISNAAKFSRTGEAVEVSVRRRGNLARFSVRDHGPGIPEEFRGRIFSKFAQADSSDTRQKGGTGLGLVIAKEIVDRHGGRLWFESEPAEGACFHADLPLAEILEPAGGVQNGERLLVCEDDADVAAILRRTLEEDGFSVDVVTTVADAVAALSVRNPYRALVLDLVLPDGDGVHLIQALRALPATRGLPIIVVSAEADRGRQALGTRALNVVDWMDKPVDIARLRRAVTAALAHSAAERPLILHVDDDHDILRVTAAALAVCGEVASVESLAKARAFLAARTPDLVVLDLALGDGSGLELLADLTDASGAAIPVLIFSAQDTDQLVLDRVAEVMTKSRTSLTGLAESVKRMLDAPPAPERRLAS